MIVFEEELQYQRDADNNRAVHNAFNVNDLESVEIELIENPFIFFEIENPTPKMRQTAIEADGRIISACDFIPTVDEVEWVFNNIELFEDFNSILGVSELELIVRRLKQFIKEKPEEYGHLKDIVEIERLEMV